LAVIVARAQGNGPRCRSGLDLGFLGASPFRCKNPRFWLLDFLGFPWILSSESRLINGLRGVNGEEKFRAGFPLCWEALVREAAVEAVRKGRIVHGASLNRFLIFCKKLLRRPFPSGRLVQKALAPSGGHDHSAAPAIRAAP
ncbi:MAG TPA: hypothetical protein VIJ63_22160, partial [Roseiarcus sp.]